MEFRNCSSRERNKMLKRFTEAEKVLSFLEDWLPASALLFNAASRKNLVFFSLSLSPPSRNTIKSIKWYDCRGFAQMSIFFMRWINDRRCAGYRSTAQSTGLQPLWAMTVDCPVIQVRLTAWRLRGRACGGGAPPRRVPASVCLKTHSDRESSLGMDGHSSGHRC